MTSPAGTHPPDHDDSPWWRQPSRLTLLGFIVIAGFFLVTEHRAHLYGILPWLLILACPLMHLFMHHGHGHGGDGGAGAETDAGPDGTGTRENRSSAAQRTSDQADR